jgi:uncharacterized damage-inducible protein DinB
MVRAEERVGLRHVYEGRDTGVASVDARELGHFVGAYFFRSWGAVAGALAGFGIATVWKQLVHIVEGEEVWVCDLQDKARLPWGEKDCATMEVLLAEKERVRLVTRAYLDSLSDAELNTTLAKRPREWVAELKSPAFILLHVVTHTFHHKGQIVAMLRTLGYPAPDTDLHRNRS